MKTLLIAAVIFLVLLTIVVLPSLGGRGLGLVSGWIWRSTWTLLGLVGATAVVVMGGAYSIVLQRRRRDEHRLL